MTTAGLARQLALLLLTVTACLSSSDDGGSADPLYGEGMCEDLVRKVTGCGVANGEGPVACGGSMLSLCGVECMLQASCDELEDLSCRKTVSPGFLQCLAACSDATLTCADGTPYAPERRCDGLQDCQDGSDETGCALFACDDGTTIPVIQRCDLNAQCPDGSDEAGCNQLVPICGSGAGGAGAGAGNAGSGGAPDGDYVSSPTESCDRILQKIAECDTSGDYYLHCYGDASTYGKCVADCIESATCEEALAAACDVTRCQDQCAGTTAYFVCDGTMELPEYLLCDGFPSCLDQSDEAGCPELPEYECPSDPGTFYLETDRCDEFNSCGTLPSADEEGCACLQAP